MPHAVKVLLKVVGIVLAAIVALLLIYVVYLTVTYNRIADYTDIPVENNLPDEAVLATGREYTVATYNIGFGAYTPGYSSFMDEGIMKDGTKTVGVHSLAASEESVRACTAGDIALIAGLDPDFILLQEVDTDSTRSYHVDQTAAFEQAFSDLASAFAVNFHSAFLAYPLHEMFGFVNSGLLTLSGAHVDYAQRRSYPVDNGHELILINNYMSAYDEGGLIRAQQLEMLLGVLETEVLEGNYVIVGGDWNHALSDSLELYESGQQAPPWVERFDESLLPEAFSMVRPDNVAEVPTCRGADIPYEKGVTYTVTVDGFIVSDNVEAHAMNIDNGFELSDHNPVLLTFTLR